MVVAANFHVSLPWSELIFFHSCGCQLIQMKIRMARWIVNEFGKQSFWLFYVSFTNETIYCPIHFPELTNMHFSYLRRVSLNNTP
jgi:hypothetical protein